MVFTRREVSAMPAQLVSSTPEKVIVQLELSLSGSMLEQEEQIQDVLNEAGRLFTGEARNRFDTDGSPIRHSSYEHSIF